MKQIFTLLTIMTLAFSMNAQYIYNDFDGNQNEAFSGWPNEPAIIANPDVSGINTSANVAEWVRSEEQWAHVICEVEGTIDFSTGTVFELKAHLPIACEVVFKLESAVGPTTELSTTVSTVNQWTQLSFDFAGAQSGLYNKIVVFFDFANTADNTFYFDDVTGPEYQAGGTGDPVDLPVTFDDENVNYALTDFGGNLSEIIIDPSNPNNKVAQSIKTEAAETWAGTTVGGAIGFSNRIPFTVDNTIMTVKVWSPTIGTTIRLKVEDAADPNISVETEALTTVANTWETLTFDFSNEATGTATINFGYNYNKASIFFNFDVTGASAGEQTYLWDDMYFSDPTGIADNNSLQLNIWPVPTSDKLNISFNNSDTYLCEIIDLTGSVLISVELDDQNNIIELSNISSGVYFLSVKSQVTNQINIKKILIN